MNETLFLLPALAGGVLIGTLFFGGLWWTVRKGISSQQPAVWFFCSMLVRLSIALSGFYFIGREYWVRWLLCLAGFFLARCVVQRYSRTREVAYAP